MITRKSVTNQYIILKSTFMLLSILNFFSPAMSWKTRMPPMPLCRCRTVDAALPLNSLSLLRIHMGHNTACVRPPTSFLLRPFLLMESQNDISKVASIAGIDWLVQIVRVKGTWKKDVHSPPRLLSIECILLQHPVESFEKYAHHWSSSKEKPSVDLHLQWNLLSPDEPTWANDQQVFLILLLSYLHISPSDSKGGTDPLPAIMCRALGPLMHWFH